MVLIYYEPAGGKSTREQTESFEIVNESDGEQVEWLSVCEVCSAGPVSALLTYFAIIIVMGHAVSAVLSSAADCRITQWVCRPYNVLLLR